MPIDLVVSQSAVSGVPRWLLVGVVLGLAGSAATAVLFAIAGRLFPAPARAGGSAPSGERRRRAELRSYLRSIEEPFAEDHFVAGQHVAFYLPKRDVAITFDARAYYRIARTETHPVLVEHEMPGTQLGARVPFETPDVATTADPGLDPTAAAFDTLECSPAATLADLKAAYRRKVKEVHPDLGGDEEAFKRVREAYTTARRQVGE